MALSKDVVIRLLGDASSAVAAQKAAADAADVSVAAYKRAERQLATQQKAEADAASAAEAAAKKRTDAYRQVGVGVGLMGAAVAAGLYASAKAAIDWESAWAGVTKVVNGTPAEMNALEGSLRQLATTLPATHEEIAGVAEAAGQLGIARGDIVEFTKVAIALGVSTNLSAEDAATGLARLSNIMGTSSSDVDRLGSVLVGLGNAGASTESEILDMGLRIAAAGHQAGMSEGDVLGLANAMSSLGIESEAGGTAISTVIKKINSSVLDGGDALTQYAQIAGMTAEQFAQAWRTNAAGALTSFIQGLDRVQKSGGNVNDVIGTLGLAGIRTSDTLLRLAAGSDGLAASLSTGNQAWAQNNALMNEANKRYQTTASQLQIARNQISDAAITVGSALLPVLAKGAEVVADFARGFQSLPGWMQDSVVIIGILAAGIGLVGGTALIAVPKLIAFRTEMANLATSGGGAASAIGKFGTFMTGPWGAAIGLGVTLLGGLITMLGATSQASKEATQYTDDLAQALRDSNGAIDQNIRAMAAKKAQDSGVLDIAQKAGVRLSVVTDALLGNRDAYNEVSGALGRYADQHRGVSGLAATAKTAHDTEGKAALDASGKLDELTGSMGSAVAKNQQLADATKGSADAADNSTGAVKGQVGALGGLTTAADDAQTALDNLKKALDGLNQPTLDLRAAEDQFYEAIDAVNGALKDNGTTLDQHTEKGRANRKALDDIAEAANKQAQAVLQSTGSNDAMIVSLEASRQSLFEQAKRFGLADDAAWAYVDSVLAIPDEARTNVSVSSAAAHQQLTDVYDAVVKIPPGKTVNVGVLSEAAMQKLKDLGFKVETLPDGTVNVTAATQSAYDSLNAFLRAPAVKVVQIVGPDGKSIGTTSGLIRNAAGARAGGGDVARGKTYLVGEEGPELVQFGASGFVTPAAQTRAVMLAAQGLRGVPVGSADASRSISIAPNVTVPTHVTLQLDGSAVTDLLEGRAVQVVTTYTDTEYNRAAY